LINIFPENYINVYPTKTALGQFHQEGSHPVFMFQNSSDGYCLDDQVMGSTRKYYKLIDEKDLRVNGITLKFTQNGAKKQMDFLKFGWTGLIKLITQVKR
jgi:hypothetical protein